MQARQVAILDAIQRLGKGTLVCSEVLQQVGRLVKAHEGRRVALVQSAYDRLDNWTDSIPDHAGVN